MRITKGNLTVDTKALLRKGPRENRDATRHEIVADKLKEKECPD